MPAYRKRRYVRKVATARRVYRRRRSVYRARRSYVRRAPARRRRVYSRVARRPRRAYPARTRIAYGGFSARRMAPSVGKRSRDLDIHAVSQGAMYNDLDD